MLLFIIPRRFGWDRSNRWGPTQSFLEWAEQKKLTHPYFHYFRPLTATDEALDNNLRPAGRPTFGLTRRMVDCNLSRFTLQYLKYLRRTFKLIPPGLLRQAGTTLRTLMLDYGVWDYLVSDLLSPSSFSSLAGTCLTNFPPYIFGIK